MDLSHEGILGAWDSVFFSSSSFSRSSSNSSTSSNSRYSGELVYFVGFASLWGGGGSDRLKLSRARIAFQHSEHGVSLV